MRSLCCIMINLKPEMELQFICTPVFLLMCSKWGQFGKYASVELESSSRKTFPCQRGRVSREGCYSSFGLLHGSLETVSSVTLQCEMGEKIIHSGLTSVFQSQIPISFHVNHLLYSLWCTTVRFSGIWTSYVYFAVSPALACSCFDISSRANTDK